MSQPSRFSRGSFGLSFGLAFAGAIMLAALSISFTNMAESSTVLPPAEQQQVADTLEDDAQVMSDAQLQELLAGQPEAIQDEILSINADARHLALQAALLSSPSSDRSPSSPTHSAWCGSPTPNPRPPPKKQRLLEPDAARRVEQAQLHDEWLDGVEMVDYADRHGNESPDEIPPPDSWNAPQARDRETQLPAGPACSA